MSRSRRLLPLLAMVVAVGAAATGYGLVARYGSAPSSPPTGTPAPASVPTATAVTGAAATSAASAFLAAWAAADVERAAGLTDDPDTAAADLNALADDLPLDSVALVPRPPTADGSIPFTVTMHLHGYSPWAFTSALRVVDGGDGPVVHWAATVIHPHLTEETRLHLAAGDTPEPTNVGDRAGRPLRATDHPSLAPVLRALGARHPTPAGTPDGQVQVVDRDSGAVVENLATVHAPAPPLAVRTTIDAALETAAERAVTVAGGDRAAGLVVIQPSTGAVLAVANNPATGFDTALRAKLAPGSTMKVVVAAALLDSGLTPDSPVPCPASVDVEGRTFHNAGGISAPGSTLANDFAISCNTAFIGQRGRLPGGALADEAGEVFGITQNWDLGFGEAATYGSVPPPGDPVTAAADLIGQGTVQMSPLAMASVAATVQAGRFRQPVFVTGTARQPASRPLSQRTAAALRQMMRGVVTGGTARRYLADLPGAIGAKTGTAQVDGQRDNSWLIAYRGDLAVGCVVEDGGASGPVVRAFLSSVP